MTIVAAIAISGMIFDVLGAVILARTFVIKRPHEVFREVRSFGCWDFPVTVGARNLLLSWLVQSREARTGAAILAFGFALQAVSQFLPKVETAWAVALLLISLVTSIWLWSWLPACFARRAAIEAQEFYVELTHETIPDDWKREIPLRQDELKTIATEPKRWLQFGEPKSPH